MLFKILSGDPQGLGKEPPFRIILKELSSNNHTPVTNYPGKRTSLLKVKYFLYRAQEIQSLHE